VLAVLAIVLSASGCGGSSQTYSVEEASAAFARHGYVLVTPQFAEDSPAREGEAILAPQDDAGFVVVVTTDSEADSVWPDFERMQDDDSFDARRANVAVFSDDGPSAGDRAKVLAALNGLPDRGSPVLVAGR
jgi:hypothetical protein